MLNTLNSHNVTCQLYFNECGKNKVNKINLDSLTKKGKNSLDLKVLGDERLRFGLSSGACVPLKSGKPGLLRGTQSLGIN